jgi:membrane fusion protein, multidrug efflux system
MSRRRGWIGLAVLAAAVFATIAVWRAARTSSVGEEGDVESVVPVRVGAVARVTLHRYVETIGTVAAEPPHDGKPGGGARVSAPVAGLVAAVSCTEGQRVARGQVLVRLDTRVADLRVARAAEAASYAEVELTRQKTMASSDATSQKAVQAAEQQLAAARNDLAAARAERELLLVRAPLAGTVVRLHVRPGDTVDPTVALAEIVDLERLVVTGGVPAAEATLLKAGQPVELTTHTSVAFAAGHGENLTGSLEFVGDQLDPRNDTAPVRIALPAGSGLRPGTLLDARIVVETRRDCLAVPVDALVTGANGNAAVAVVAGDKAVMTPVRAGVRDRGLVEVEGAGLGEGTPVVVEGAYGLPQETRIRVTGR